MTRYGITEDHEYNATHKRKRIVIWSGTFSDQYEAEAFSLPKNNGFMIDTGYAKIRVECPVERTDATYEEQDKAINDALNAHYAKELKGTLSDDAIAVALGIEELVQESKQTRYRANGKSVIRKR